MSLTRDSLVETELTAPFESDSKECLTPPGCPSGGKEGFGSFRMKKTIVKTQVTVPRDTEKFARRFERIFSCQIFRTSNSSTVARMILLSIKVDKKNLMMILATLVPLISFLFLSLLPKCHSLGSDSFGIPGQHQRRYDEYDLQYRTPPSSPSSSSSSYPSHSSLLFPWFTSLYHQDSSSRSSPPPFTSVNPFAEAAVFNPSNPRRGRSRLMSRTAGDVVIPEGAASPVSLPNVWNSYLDPLTRGPAVGQSHFNPPMFQNLPSPFSPALWSRSLSRGLSNFLFQT